MRAHRVVVPLGVACAAVLFFAAGYNWHGLRGTPPAAVQAQSAPAPQKDSSTVRFAAGAAQLQFVRSEQLVSLPEPLLEPLNGRIAYDENYTARVSSPIAGRITKIEVQPGDTVRAARPRAPERVGDRARLLQRHA